MAPLDSPTPIPDMGTREERRSQNDRRDTWTADELYSRLRTKREEIESERRHRGRRASDINPSQDHAA
jgi:hypothetical protein